MMDMKCSRKFLTSVCIISFLLGSCSSYQSLCVVDAREDSVTLQVDASNASGRPIPETLFGIFFEEINHAGAGGLWAELVSNRVLTTFVFNKSSMWNVVEPHLSTEPETSLRLDAVSTINRRQSQKILKQFSSLPKDIDPYFWKQLDLDDSTMVKEPETNRGFIAMLSKLALTKHNAEMDTSLEMGKILKANFYLSAGPTFYISFEVNDPSDGNQTKPYK